MNDKTSNTIALKQQIINELEKISLDVKESVTNDIRFRIETKHWYGYSEPFLKKDRHILDVSKDTMQSIINSAIEKEKEGIEKLIDMEIQKRIGGK